MTVRRGASTISPTRSLFRLAAAFAVLVLCFLPSFPVVTAAGPYQASGGQPAAPGPASAIPAARKAKNVVIITIDRAIDPLMARSVARRMEEAEAAGADAIVFELNTPGGDLGAVREISAMIKRSKIPNTVAWVNPMAYSGGAVIALACREIVVSDHAAMGDAAIIAMSFGFMNERLGETERQKFLGPLLLEVVNSARLRGYDERLVQAFISRGVDLILIRNTHTGEQLFISKEEYRRLFGEDPPVAAPTIPAASGGISYHQETGGMTPPVGEGQVGGSRHGTTNPAPMLPVPGDDTFEPAIPNLPVEVVSEVRAQLDRPSQRPQVTPQTADQWVWVENVATGEGILTLSTDELLRYRLAAETINSDEELATFFGAQNLARLNESWSERMVVFLTSTLVRGVLIVVFLIALFIEMTHPGLILPGTIAALALVVLIAPPFLNNMASWWEIAAILAGIACIAAEIFIFPGFGVFGVLGIVLLFGGLLGTFTGSGGLFPDSPQGQQDLMYGVATLVVSTVTAGILGYVIVRHLGSLPVVGRMVLQDVPTEDEASGGMLEAMDPAPAPGVHVGAEGVALTPLRPAGRVQVGDEIIDVVAEGGFVPAGATVRIISISAFRTTVERAGPSARDGDGPRPDAAPGTQPGAGDPVA